MNSGERNLDPEQLRSIGLNYLGMDLSFDERQIAFEALDKIKRNIAISTFNEHTLDKLCESELFALISTLRTGDRKLQNSIAQKVAAEVRDDKIDNEAFQLQLRIAELYFENPGYALQSDFEGLEDKARLFKALNERKYVTIHPLPYYKGPEAPAFVFIRNSENLHENVVEYAGLLKDKASPAKRIESGTPRAITIQKATKYMRDKYCFDSIRPAMVRAVVGLAYGGSIPLRSDKTFMDMSFTEFTNEGWQRALHGGVDPKLSGPVYSLNFGETGKFLARRRDIEIREGQDIIMFK